MPTSFDDAVKVVATRRTAVLVDEVLRGRVCSSDRQTCQPVIPDWQVPGLLQACSGTAAPEEGPPRQFITGELQADIELVDHIQGTGATRFGTTSTSPAQLSQLQPVPVGIQGWSLHGDCTAGSSQWCLHSDR